MNRPSLTSRARARLVPLLLALAAALALPAAASASIGLQIVNQSGREDVYVTVHGTDYEVGGIPEDEPRLLSEIPGGELTLTNLIAGRVYISYGAGVKEGVTFESPTRFDWAELTVENTPKEGPPTGTANLTAVDQFAIGMRMETLNGADEVLETLGEANSNTIFDALQGIPGGAASTVRNGSEIIRVLSPAHSTAYPLLDEYVKSMAGQTITLHTAFYGTPFTVTEYSGTFAADGSIVLHGTTNPVGGPATIGYPAAQLIPEIYAPTTNGNSIEEAVKRDLLAGFSTGLWGGRYGNDALSFCTNRLLKPEGWICPEGFNQPAFGDARVSFPPFPTCDQYAAVLNQYSDSYGSAYTDASKKTTVGLEQPGVAKLRLTILPDSGSAMPVDTGNPNCGAGPAPAAAAGGSTARPRVHFLKRSKFKRGRARVARLFCGTACGRVRAVAKHGRKVVGRVNRGKVEAAKPWVVVHLTGPGKWLLRRSHRLVARVNLFVRPAGAKWSRYHHKVKLFLPR